MNFVEIMARHIWASWVGFLSLLLFPVLSLLLFLFLKKKKKKEASIMIRISRIYCNLSWDHGRQARALQFATQQLIWKIYWIDWRSMHRFRMWNKNFVDQITGHMLANFMIWLWYLIKGFIVLKFRPWRTHWGRGRGCTLQYPTV